MATNREPRLRVLIANDISYVAATAIPELQRLGIEARLAGRKTHPTDGPRRSFVRDSVATFRVLLHTKADVLHINYALFGFLSVAMPGVPTVLHFHGEDIRGMGKPLDRLVSQVSRHSASLATVLWHSTTDLGSIMRRFGLVSSYMPNPIANQFFESSSEHPTVPAVLFAVPLTAIKGAADAIQAMNLLAGSKPSFRLLAFGFGPDETEAAAFRKQISKQVELLPWTNHARLPELLAGVSLVVGQLKLGILSLLELEAMAAGRGVVMRMPVSPRASEPYYQDDPPVVHCDSPEDIALTVTRIAERPGELLALGARSRDWASRYHGAPTVARLYAAEYRKLTT